MLQYRQTRTARFGAGSVIMRAAGAEPIPMESIAARAPAVFAEEAHESRSSRFSYIPTREVLDGLAREGFRPFEVRQGGSRVAGKREFTKHMVRLRHASAEAFEVGRTGAAVPEIVLLNAHDGTSSYKLTAGVFRMVCTNGLIAGNAFESFTVPHKGDVQGDVIDAAFRVVSEFPAVIDAAREMAGRTLTAGQQLAFARSAAELRWPSEDQDGARLPTAPIEAAALLSARRSPDAGPDTWSTFNRTQENIIRGGQRYVLRDANGRRRQSRTVGEVRGIDQDRSLNRAMWTLAQELQRLTA